MSEPNFTAPKKYTFSGDDVPEPVRLLDVIERYVATNQNVTAERTIRGHRATVAHLSRYLDRPATTADLNEDTLGGWFRHRMTEVSRNTTNGEASALIAVWKWCAMRQLAPPPTIGPPSRSIRTPRALKIEQLRDLFETASKTRQQYKGIPGNVYWPAILHLLWQTGERIGSVRSLQWGDIDLDQGWVRFPPETRKGGTQELVRPINATAIDRLQRLQEHGPAAPFGEPRGGVFYTYWHALMAEAGLPEWVTPHTIRKSVASHLPSLDDACEMLGHSSSAVTKRNYRDPTMGDTRSLLDKLPSVERSRGLFDRLFGRKPK